MTDYGLIAYNRTEEINREKVENNFKENVYINNIICNTGTKVLIGHFSTNVNELINFKISSNKNFTVQIFVNNEINYIGPFNNADFIPLFLTGKSKVEIKFLSLMSEKFLFKIAVSGKFNITTNIKNLLFSGTQSLMLYRKNNEFDLLIFGIDATSITSGYNGFTNIVTPSVVCGNYYENTFYSIVKENNVYKLMWGSNTIELTTRFDGDCVMNITKGDAPLKVLCLKNGSLNFYELNLNGEVLLQKTLHFASNICVTNIYALHSVKGIMANKNYIIVKDSLNKFYLLLCNYENMASYSNNLSCIALSKSGESASGFITKNNEFAVLIKGKTGITQIMFSVVDTQTVPQKLSESFIPNADAVYFTSETNRLVEYKGYLQSYD